LNIFKNYESNLKLRKERSYKKSETSNKEKTENEQEQKFNKRRCYNCNDVGHIATECPKERKQCEICKKHGHLKEKCRNKRMDLNCIREDEIESSGNLKNPKENEEEVTMEIGRDGMVGTIVVLGNHVSTVDALVDSGSSVSCISNDLVFKSGLNIDKTQTIKVFGINNSELNVMGKVSALVIVKNRSFSISMWVVSNKTSSFQLILGRDFLNENNIKRICIEDFNAIPYENICMLFL
jgi:hypothetical protein